MWAPIWFLPTTSRCPGLRRAPHAAGGPELVASLAEACLEQLHVLEAPLHAAAAPSPGQGAASTVSYMGRQGRGREQGRGGGGALDGQGELLAARDLRLVEQAAQMLVLLVKLRERAGGSSSGSKRSSGSSNRSLQARTEDGPQRRGTEGQRSVADSWEEQREGVGEGEGEGGGSDVVMLPLVHAVSCWGVRLGLASALEPRPLQDLVWALGKLYCPSYDEGHYGDLPYMQAFLQQLGERLEQPGLLSGMAPVGLSMLVYGAAKAGMPYTYGARMQVYGAVAEAARSGGCSPQAVANMAWGLSRSVAVTPAEATAAPQAAAQQQQQQQQGHLQQQQGQEQLPLFAPAGQPHTAGSQPTGAAPPPATHAQPPRRMPDGTQAELLARRTALDALALAATSTAAPQPNPTAGALSTQEGLLRFAPREAANLLGALAALGSLQRHPQLLHQAYAYCAARWLDLGPRDVSELLYSFASAQTNPSHTSTAPSALTQAHQLTSPPAAASSAWGLQHQAGEGWTGGGSPLLGSPPTPPVPLPSEELLALLERRCVDLMPYMEPYQLATALWAWAHLAAAGAGAGGAHQPAELLAAVGARLDDGAAALGAAAGGGEEAEEEAGPSSDRRGSEVWVQLPGEALARLLWALARLQAPLSDAAVGVLCGAVERRVGDLDAQVGARPWFSVASILPYSLLSMNLGTAHVDAVVASNQPTCTL